MSTSAFSVTGNGGKRFVSVFDCVLDCEALFGPCPMHIVTIAKEDKADTDL